MNSISDLRICPGFGLYTKSYALPTATSSAFVQQRAKLLPVALEYILHQFTLPSTQIKRFEGYRLLAVDGSDLLTLANPKEPENFFLSNPNSKGYNLLHLNALYDLCNGLYIDALLQNRRSIHEHQALTAMVDRSPIADKVIILGDRGYESYNNLAHIARKGWHYLFRVKDISGNGILSSLALPDTHTFDVAVHRILTRKQTNEVKQNSALYHFLPSNSTFDFLDLHENPFYPVDFRVVRFKITADAYEAIVTNLDPDAFPPEKLMQLYNLRWGIETAFRSLKYTVGLLAFHSKKGGVHHTGGFCRTHHVQLLPNDCLVRSHCQEGHPVFLPDQLLPCRTHLLSFLSLP